MPRPTGKYRYLRRVFVELAKAAFTNHDIWPYIAANESSGLLVLDSWASNEEFPEERPRVVISRSAMSSVDPVIGPWKAAPPIDSLIQKEYFLFKNGGIALNCVASSDLVTDDLAAEVEKYVYAAKDDLRARGILVSGVVVAAPQRMDEKSSFPKWFYTGVNVSIYSFNESVLVEDDRDKYQDADVTVTFSQSGS